jgi:hypothetical protein
VAEALRVLDYSDRNFAALRNAWQVLRRASRMEEADALLRANHMRFAGNPEREEFLVALAEDTGDLKTHIALLEEKIREQPRDWKAYSWMASALLRDRRPQSAREVLLGYPEFRNAQSNPVELSNLAEEGASILWDAGEVEESRGLHELAIAYGTGSGAEMLGRMRLGLLAGDWQEAIAWGRTLHERYQSAYGHSRAASLLFLTGASEEGWRMFHEGAKQFNHSRPWEAAIAGHRLAATPADELVDFARRWETLSGSGEQQAWLRGYFLFNLLLLDRPAEDAALKAVMSVAGKAPDRYFDKLAPGYFAFKRGEYAAAMEKLGPLYEASAKESRETKWDNFVPLPYLTAALVRLARDQDADAMLKAHRDQRGRDFHYLLAAAYLEGGRGEQEKAAQLLWEAFVARPGPQDLPIPPRYQLLESCENLLHWTGDERYRTLLLEFARRMQRAWPDSSVYAFDARYAGSADERTRAFAVALYLDRESEHLQALSDAQRKHAAAWVAANNPFKR